MVNLKTSNYFLYSNLTIIHSFFKTAGLNPTVSPFYARRLKITQYGKSPFMNIYKTIGIHIRIHAPFNFLPGYYQPA